MRSSRGSTEGGVRWATWALRGIYAAVPLARRPSAGGRCPGPRPVRLARHLALRSGPQPEHRFTFESGNERWPTWSPDGRRLAYHSADSEGPAVFQKQATGTGAPELLFRAKSHHLPMDWSADGRMLALQTLVPGMNMRWDVWTYCSKRRKQNPSCRTPTGDGRRILAGRPVARVRVRRVGTKRDLRAGVPRPGSKIGSRRPLEGLPAGGGTAGSCSTGIPPELSWRCPSLFVTARSRRGHPNPCSSCAPTDSRQAIRRDPDGNGSSSARPYTSRTPRRSRSSRVGRRCSSADRPERVLGPGAAEERQTAEPGGQQEERAGFGHGIGPGCRLPPVLVVERIREVDDLDAIEGEVAPHASPIDSFRIGGNESTTPVRSVTQ